MAGEDVVIRVGVDYSAAIAQTRQFEQELRRILTSAAQVQVEKFEIFNLVSQISHLKN